MLGASGYSVAVRSLSTPVHVLTHSITNDPASMERIRRRAWYVHLFAINCCSLSYSIALTCVNLPRLLPSVHASCASILRTLSEDQNIATRRRFIGVAFAPHMVTSVYEFTVGGMLLRGSWNTMVRFSHSTAHSKKEASLMLLIFPLLMYFLFIFLLVFYF